MNKKLPLSLVTLFLLTACGNSSTPIDISIAKQASSLLQFKSNDESLDRFLNDFIKRHAGWTNPDADSLHKDMSVNSIKPGTALDGLFNLEWNSIGLMCWDSNQSMEIDRQNGVRNLLASCPVDDYGFAWDGPDMVRSIDPTVVQTATHSMGWPFPNTDSSKGYSTAWDFNGKASESIWSSNFNASVDGGLFTGRVTDRNMIYFESPLLKGAKTIVAYHAPIIELDLRYLCNDFNNIDDIYIYFKTKESNFYSQDKKVSLSEVSCISYDQSAVFEHLINVPMYANPYWGDSEDTEITQIKIEIVAKEGKTFSGKFGLNYVRPTYDTRHVNNNSVHISAVKQDYKFTGDLNYLTKKIVDCRKAMNFYLQMYDWDKHLNNQSYLVGHDGNIRPDSDISAVKMASSLSNGYWDISFLPIYDLQSNVYFYKAISDLIDMETVLKDNGITVDYSLSDVKTAKRNAGYDISKYRWDIEDLKEIQYDTRLALQESTNDETCTGFYDKKVGRFISGYDAQGVKLDYGMTQWNLECITYGIATSEQAKSIMDWISGKRIPSGDANVGEGSFVGKDIYKWEFAPACTTLDNPRFFSGSYTVGPKFGLEQVQYGGAILYNSYYDLLSRLKVYGANDAYERLQGISTWYNRILDWWGDRINTEVDSNWNFYWNYYLEVVGLELQSGVRNGTGLFGLDSEFQESIITAMAVPHGFFGIDSKDGKTLEINPSLPNKLNYWKLENLMFNNIKYDVQIRDGIVEISAVKGNATGINVNVSLDKPSGKFNVYVDGELVEDYQIINNKVVVKTTLNSHIIQVA